MIRVASYNIRRGLGTDWRRSLARTMAVLREVGADVVALQESEPELAAQFPPRAVEAIAAETAYIPVSFGPEAKDVGWRGNMLLVRETVSVTRASRVALKSPEEPRGAIVADLVAADTAVRVVGLHLGLLGGWRKRQAIELLQHVEETTPQLPMIIMGDFNEWRENKGSLLHFLAAHDIAATGLSFHSRLPVASLDKIMHSRDLEAVAAGVHHSPLARRASDHLPIWAHLVRRSRPSEHA